MLDIREVEPRIVLVDIINRISSISVNDEYFDEDRVDCKQITVNYYGEIDRSNRNKFYIPFLIRIWANSLSQRYVMKIEMENVIKNLGNDFRLVTEIPDESIHLCNEKTICVWSWVVNAICRDV